MTTRVVLADDQPVVRVGFRTLLELTEDLVVVGEAADGARAIELARAARPDVVLMDVRMPGVDGIEATRRICADADLADVRVLVLTTFDVDQHVLDAVRAGASGFLLKDVEPDELYAAVRDVAAGHGALAPPVARMVVERLRADPAAVTRPELVAGLTERERDVVRMVGRGLNNEEVAAELVMSPLTAKTHVSRAMGKLGARDRAQLVVLAYESGLVAVGGGHASGPAPR